ncbi:Clp protease N-terminal domain-containing protein [Nocardiopsis chromatogenes]|uniref:Clp protease N-terminal domain-containing protein n=1 Tax=Nocardiopsis chromatogenes TaxID=280239 RepID=UPI001EF9D202|nr:Clp protease N-terminal domain-containing protein [Nocardiopsis chromatogenes]
MFERFSGDARRTVVQAQHEARGLGHGRIGTVHLLLGLLDPGDDPATAPAARVLSEHGATAEAVRRAAQEAREAREPATAPGRRPRTGRLFGSHIPFSKRAKKAMELSLREALRFDRRRIDGSHILLGVLRTGGGASGALEQAGVDTDALRRTAEQIARASDGPR